MTVTQENLLRQLKRLNTLTEKTYHYVTDEPIMVDQRWCLVDSKTEEEVSRWYLVGEMWENMYSMIRLMLNEADKPRTWEE